MIPMLDLKREMLLIGDEIKEAINKSLEKTYFVMGPNVNKFEKDCAKYLGSKYAVGVANGTDALLLSIIASGIKEGDEVITTPFTFIATSEAIARAGAVPVFVDIDAQTMNIDTKLIREKISKKTKAILPVHIFGNPCNMKEIKKIATEFNLLVIEDCAQSFGAEYSGTKTGNIGDMGCFSFFPSKNLGCYGDGGLITTNREDIYEILRALQSHGSFKKYSHNLIGFNSRLDDIQAAILNVKLGYIDKFNQIRRELADLYKEILNELLGYQVQTENAINVYHQFTVRSDVRNKIMGALQQHNIASAIYYPIPLHLQKCFSYLQYKRGDLATTEKMADEVLSLPMNPFLKKEEIFSIGEIIKTVLSK